MKAIYDVFSYFSLLKCQQRYHNLGFWRSAQRESAARRPLSAFSTLRSLTHNNRFTSRSHFSTNSHATPSTHDTQRCTVALPQG